MSGEPVPGRLIKLQSAEPNTWCQGCLPNESNEVNDATVRLTFGRAVETQVYLCDDCKTELGRTVR